MGSPQSPRRRRSSSGQMAKKRHWRVDGGRLTGETSGAPEAGSLAGSLLSGDALLCGWLGQARCRGVRWDWFSSESAPRSDTTRPVSLDDWTVGSHMRGPEWGLQVLSHGGTFSLSRTPSPKSQMYVCRDRYSGESLSPAVWTLGVPCGLASPVHS